MSFFDRYFFWIVGALFAALVAAAFFAPPKDCEAPIIAPVTPIDD